MTFLIQELSECLALQLQIYFFLIALQNHRMFLWWTYICAGFRWALEIGQELKLWLCGSEESP